MTYSVESINLAGAEITLTLRPPVHPAWLSLAAAAAVRVLECYPAFDQVVLRWGPNQFNASRARVEEILQPDGFTAVVDRARWQETVNRLLLDHVEGQNTD